MVATAMRGFLLGAATMLALAAPTVACGPQFTNAVFVNDNGPDNPETYLRGELGIVLPSYAPSWLVAAYRHLSGSGFGKNEQELLFPKTEAEKPDAEEEFRAWLKDRSTVPKVTATVEVAPYRYLEESYQQYLNCTTDAFATARKTLRERLEDYGPFSGDLQGWVAAQDQVFANCSGSEEIVPAAAAPGSRPLVRADREYQIAAANFYAGRFDEAEKRFRSIAADTASPWREIAPYLAVRALVRKGTLVGEGMDFDPQVLAAAEKELLALLADGKTRRYRDDARRLLALVRFRLHPAERFVELGSQLAKPSHAPTLNQDFKDFGLLATRLTGPDLAKVDPLILRTDLTDWIASLSATEASVEDHVFQRWQQNKSTLWLIAALAGVRAGHPGAGELLTAASKLPATDPGFISVNFYRARLLAAGGKTAEARTVLRALAERQEVKRSASAVNIVRAELLEMAESLEDFLRNAARLEAGENYGGQSQPGNPELQLFDDDAARQLNWGMPLVMLKQAALQTTQSRSLRGDLLLAATIKAVLLQRPEVVQETLPPVAALFPEMQAPLADYLQAVEDSDRDFAAAVLLLKFPGALPYIHAGLRVGGLADMDSYSEKWWCDLTNPQDTEQGEASQQLRIYPTFVTDAERAAAEEEGAQFLELETALNVLTEEVIARVESHPDDPRLPEALHRVITYARYGCTDGDTRKLSKRAFQLLHKKYAHSDWAKKTKYWY